MRLKTKTTDALILAELNRGLAPKVVARLLGVNKWRVYHARRRNKKTICQK